MTTDPHYRLPRTDNDSGYPKGAIIVCAEVNCFKPIFVLERGIGPGDKAGRAASAFRPVTRADLRGLVERPDLDVGYRNALRQWINDGHADDLVQAARPVAGDGMVCPLCGDQFTKMVTDERTQLLDRAGVHTMEWIPPFVAATHPRLGLKNRWVPTLPSDDELRNLYAVPESE